MKNLSLFFLILLLLSCEKNDIDGTNRFIGKWKYVKGFSQMAGGNFIPNFEDQRIVQYNNTESITYDYLGNEISRCNYYFNDSTITSYGTNLNGVKWNINNKYWFLLDTLKIRQDGGFEFYYEYFKRISN